MRIKPMTEDEINRANLLPAGIYPFSIIAANERQSKSGNDMIVLDVDIYNSDGRAVPLKDYLLEAIPYKIRHICQLCGLMAEYEGGYLTPEMFVGKTGQCKVAVNPAKDQFKANNSIKDYVVKHSEVALPEVARLPVDLNDEIPF